MNRDELARGFAELLGLSIESVFEYEDTDYIVLSSWALQELGSVITLPEGYELTPEIRVPNPEEFFLDLQALVDEERVVVYKATGKVTNANLILEPIGSELSELTTEKDGFDFFLCMLQGGLAMYNEKIVRLLMPAVDKDGKVVVVDKGKFNLVTLKNLRHVESPEAIGSGSTLGGLSLSDIHNKLKDIGWSNASEPKTPDDPWKDRWGITFDDD